MRPWTARVPDGPAGFGELGDLLGNMVRRSAPCDVCAFCHTARRGTRRCDVCGARPGPAPALREGGAQQPGPRAPVPPPAAAVLARMLGMLLFLPLLLFFGFGIWFSLHQSESAVGVRATPASAGAMAPPREVPVHARLTLPWASMDSTASDRMAGTVRTDAAPAPFRSQAVMGAQMAAGAPVVAAGPGATPAQRNASGLRRAASPVREPRQRLATPVASMSACVARSFLLRAVCINNVCAQADQRDRPHCAQAVAQRQIDERRRDFALLN